MYLIVQKNKSPDAFIMVFFGITQLRDKNWYLPTLAGALVWLAWGPFQILCEKSETENAAGTISAGHVRAFLARALPSF